MEEKEFSKTYNKFEQAKKRSVSVTKIQSISSVIIVIAVLVWAFSVYTNSFDKIKVVDTTGQALSHETMREQQLIKTLITSHCERTIFFANSFDRFTLKSNQANTYFLMDKEDANRVFSTFKNSKMYGDVLKRGWQYKATFDRMVSITGKEPPYKVQFTSYIDGIKGESKEKLKVKSEGMIDIHTPKYPENPFGYFFTSYKQNLIRISNE